MKRIIICRYGAWGDSVILTPVLKRLKEDGYHITLNCTKRAFPVLKYNPNIDAYLMQEDDLIPNNQLSEYWAEISKGYDRFLNMSETLEAKFLFSPFQEKRFPDPNNPDEDVLLRFGQKEYYLSVEERRALCSHTNYYDYALQVAGYNDVEKPTGELYYSPLEEALCRAFRERFKDYFLILWCLSGSSMHKMWLGAEETALNLLFKHKDIITLTVGDYPCKLIEWQDQRNISMIGEWDIRTSMLMTKYVDLVISPETGILNAAGCFDTPKIGLLTHSSKTNLTKHFNNDYSIQAHIDCSPCHRMIYMDNFRDCPLIGGGEEKGGIDACACAGTESFQPRKVMQVVEEVYDKWKSKRRGVPFVRQKRPGIVLYGPQGQTLPHSKGIAV